MTEARGNDPKRVEFSLRPASAADFDYCAKLYVAEAARDNPAAGMTAILESLTTRWDAAEVRMIIIDGASIGWLQTLIRDETLFLRQFMIEDSFRRRGIGAAVMTSLLAEAARAGRPMTLGVVKTNPARRLYERFGFRITHDDERKFYMRREAD